MTLDQLQVGETGVIQAVGGSGALRQHLLNMGLTPGTEVTLCKVAPMGDPMELILRGYVLTLRLEDARKITIENIGKKPVDTHKLGRYNPIPHPGEGELGHVESYHAHKTKKSIPEDQQITFALIGNQNSGKTTLFNRLTGANQHVGNFPGVTVDRKDGFMRRHPNVKVTDLPGIYSLSPYSSEEVVTRDFLLNSNPEGIINIVDATNIERNLYLTMQLMELGIPMVLALNMMDEVRDNGGSVRINELEAILGLPVVPISAAKNEGIDELVDHALHVARFREVPSRIDFCPPSDDPSDPLGVVHRAIHAAAHLLEPMAKKADMPVRFATTKMIEGDPLMSRTLCLSEQDNYILDQIIAMMEEEGGLDRNAALANMRFNFIEKLCRDTVVKPQESKEHRRSVAIDRILTGKYTAIPVFIGIMALVFMISFSWVGAYLSDLMVVGIDNFANLVDSGLSAISVNPVIHSLIVDGIINGVGAVLSFLPTIVTLFFCLSILEDTGYMARVAFVMDKILRKIGLSGRSIVPMLIGFGCSVPAIMATRTLSSERDRKMTILLTPFMSCSAKLPIYGLLTSAFFEKQWRGLIMVGLYIFGILIGILFALILKKTRFKGEPVPFVLELPNYRLPGLKNVLQLIWEKAKGFIQKAFTIIFLASVVVWFLQTFDPSLNIAESTETSLLAMIGRWIAPLFVPLGFGDWRVATALVIGFTAKENVVSTLNILVNGELSMLTTLFSPFTALIFLIFTLLYTPCVAAIAAARRELGTRLAGLKLVVLQCGIAWIVAFVVRMVGMLFGLR